MDYYAGIGSRDTPEHILNIMHHIGAYLATQGWVLRSGAAKRADTSFEEGAIHGEGETEIYLPWKDFNHHKSELHPGNYPFSTKEKQFTTKFHYILEFTHRAIEDASAYNYVVNQVKH